MERLISFKANLDNNYYHKYSNMNIMNAFIEEGRKEGRKRERTEADI